MDPLSVASGIAGLVKLTEIVISRTWNTVIACMLASKDSRRLLCEVQALSGLLQGLASLESKLGSRSLQSQISAKQVLECQQTLQNIRDKLDKADPKEKGISIVQKTKRTLIWPLTSTETDGFLAEMERHKSGFDLALSLDALDAMLAFDQAEEELVHKVDQVKVAVERLWKVQSAKEDRNLLRLVGADDADESYRTNLELHQSGTGAWFFEDGKAFRKWMDGSSSRLWVHGIPGAGKTVLSALSIAEAAKTASFEHAVIFYYCRPGLNTQKRMLKLLGCFIGQLARQHGDCMSILRDKSCVSDDMASATWMHSRNELMATLRCMLRLFSDVSMVVDGIDEFDNATDILESLVSLTDRCSHVRFLLFSRKEPEFRPILCNFGELCVAAESQDLRLYVPAQIRERVRLGKLRIRNSNTKDEIVEKLVGLADGM